MIHPACPYCWRWKGWTPHDHTILPTSGGKGCTLHVHSGLWSASPALPSYVYEQCVADPAIPDPWSKFLPSRLPDTGSPSNDLSISTLKIGF
jgi:hypothetical protein